MGGVGRAEETGGIGKVWGRGVGDLGRERGVGWMGGVWWEGTLDRIDVVAEVGVGCDVVQNTKQVRDDKLE